MPRLHADSLVELVVARTAGAQQGTRFGGWPVRGVVGIVSPRYAPAIGGVEKHVERIATGLTRKGVRVEVITTDPSGTLPPVETIDGVLVRRFPTIAHDSVYFLSPGLAAWLFRNAASFTLLHAHSYHTPLAFQAAVAANRAHIPLLVTLHYHGTGHTTFRRLLHVPYRLAGSWTVHHARQVICVSESERELVHQHFGGSIPTTVIPNGVDVDEIVRGQPAVRERGRTQVLTVGRLESYKQIDVVIAAFRELPECYYLTVVGEGPIHRALQAQVDGCGLGDRVQLLGSVPRERLVALYRSTDVFVSPSRHEAFGLTLLEAGAAGASIVASDIPAHREVLSYLPSDMVSLVGVNSSPSELARAIRASATAAERPARTLSGIPTWEAAVDSVLKVYQNVLGG